MTDLRYGEFKGFVEVQDGTDLSVDMLAWEGGCLKEKRRLPVDKP